MLRDRREAAWRWRRRGNRYDYDPPLPDDAAMLAAGGAFELKPAPPAKMGWRTLSAIALFAAAYAIIAIPDIAAAARRLFAALLA